MLRLFAERIFDALAHDELPFGKAGIAHESQRLALDDPDLIVRHVDLRAWMSYYYPGERPQFLFDEIERELHPAVNLATLNVLLADRRSVKVQLAELAQLHAALQAQYEALAKEHAVRIAESSGEREPGLRSESTYLNIIGGLLTLLLGKSPAASPIHPSRTWTPWSVRCWPTMKDGPASASARCGASSPRLAATWRHRANPQRTYCNCSGEFCCCSELRGYGVWNARHFLNSAIERLECLPCLRRPPRRPWRLSTASCAAPKSRPRPDSSAPTSTA